MKKIFVLLMSVLVSSAALYAQQKTIMFDLAHSQCRGIEPGFETYPKVVPTYQSIADEIGARLVLNEDKEITSDVLRDVDVLIMLSPLSNTLQKDLTQTERTTLVSYVLRGGSLIFFIDDEHRVDNERYGGNDVTGPFGITFGPDAEVPFNSGAVSFKNEIFSDRLEIPYSGARNMQGGVPVSVSMVGGYLHASTVTLANGGKLYAGSDTMVGLFLGTPDGKQGGEPRMIRDWFGKDNRQYMTELIEWALKK